MKNFFKSLFVSASVILTFASCQNKEDDLVINDEGQYMYSFVVSNGEATIDADTKVSIGDGNIEWDDANDQVGVFIGTNYEGYAKIDISSSPKKAILYSKTAIASGTMVYSYFPYDAANKDSDTYNPDFAKIVLNSIQEGASNSAMPLAGIPFEVESDIAAQATEGNGEIKFLNLGSIINFKFYSSTYAGEEVQYVELAADGNKTIAGDAVLDLTAIDAADASTLELAFMANETNTVKVNQTVAVAADKAGATPLKMVVAPETFSGVLTVVTDVATYTVNIPSRTYNRSGSRTFNVNLDGKPRVLGQPEIVKTLPYAESFASNIGEFETDGVQAGTTDVWTWGGASYGMKASAYVSGTRYATESWLTSPWIDLTSVSAAAVTFDHVYRYTNSPSDHLTFWVLTDEGGASWEQVTIPYSTGTNWDFVSSGEILLNSYVGNKVKIGFKYISTATNNYCGTWEIKNVNVYEKVYTTEFTMDADAITVEVGKTKNNNVTVNSGATITYSSDDVSVATVAADGTVTGVAEGTTYINVHVDANAPYPAEDDLFEVTVTAASAGDALPFNDDMAWADNGASDSNSDIVSTISTVSSGLYTEASGKVYKGIGGLKLGSGTSNGTITTKELNLSGAFYIAIEGEVYGTDTGKLVVSIDGNEEINESFASVNYVNISAGTYTSSSQVTIGTSAKRGRIYSVTIASGEYTPSPVINVTSSNPIAVANTASSQTIEYTIDNPSAATLTAALQDPADTWISNINYSNAGQVTFDVAAQETDAAARSAVIVLSYSGASDVEVTVNQAAGPSSGGKTEYTATLTISSHMTADGDLTDDKGNTWSVAAVGNYSGSETNLIHIGTTNSAATSITLTSSDYSSVDIKEVHVWAAAKASTNVTTKISIDDVLLGTSSVLGNTTVSGGTEYSVSNTGNESGEIKVEVSRPSSAKGAIYFVKLTVVYEN